MGDIEGSAAFGEPVDAIVSALDAGRARAMASVARERFATYHAIGSAILARQQAQGWGSQVIKRLAADLRMRFPDQTGLGVRNLHYMRKVALAWPDPNCAAAAAQLPWGHEIVLLDRLPDTSQRDWYAAQAYAGGWSRGALFADRLPAPDSDLAQRATRDPVVLDFLGLAAPARERLVEDAMMDNLTRTMLELGNGLAFVGRQVPLHVGEQEFFADLVFFHYPSLRFIVFEIKVGRFEPHDAGQLAFYVEAADRLLRDPASHAPTIGVLLCTGRDDEVVEYSLASTTAPAAVATYTYDQLPDDVREVLPPEDSITRAIEPVDGP
ncbi:LOW QUALITY PROTEIN: putative nuclease of restriction endonuclease-like (RecB) superfamily [Propionibacteriaceae bacterium ES.041]|nr:LOW QUALITY PROTEIN: putative nuclease of restriction endonuclease-like (RecB) superfamily [Propionibacteriaceae bacterium ES.041]